MEVSVVGNPRAKIGRMDLVTEETGFSNFRTGRDGICRILPRNNKICFRQSQKWGKSGTRFTLMAVQSEAVLMKKVPASSGKTKSHNGVRLYVGLPPDAVSDRGTVNYERAIAVGLKALKLLGVEGVELPVWWGIAEKESMGKFEWTGYLALAEMVKKAGLKLHVSLCFHASKQPKIPLPDWVSRIGESQPDIFFTDRSGHRYKDCLSLAVDALPVLNGKTPLEVYREFFESFKSVFSNFMGSTITGISVGLGPAGELQYPSHHLLGNGGKVQGVGEFQCYDKNMLSLLKQHSEATGNPLWGSGGPHDAPSCEQSPNSNNFFKDHGGSWETPYGDFFLSWYSKQLIIHGNEMLCTASTAFSDTDVEIYGKIPLMHSWYKTRSHPSELTAGFYNTQTRDGYDAVAEMFARNSVRMIVPGVDLLDNYQPSESLSSPESLLAQIRTACRNHGVEVSLQNSSLSGTSGIFEQIEKNLSREKGMNMFIYQRMGAHFFSPEHFRQFTAFVKGIYQHGLQLDDQVVEDREPVGAGI